MPFEPAVTNLNTLDELKNLSHTITYTGYVGSTATSYPVTVTPVEENSTITVSQNTISGYYTDSFNNSIHYRNKDDTFTTVNKFSEINNTDLYGIDHYNADENRTKVYSYLAEANSEQKLYTITVTNNWNSGRTQLLKYNNPEYYNIVSISWVNSTNNIILWKTSDGTALNWIRNQ